MKLPRYLFVNRHFLSNAAVFYEFDVTFVCLFASLTDGMYSEVRIPHINENRGVYMFKKVVASRGRHIIYPKDRTI